MNTSVSIVRIKKIEVPETPIEFEEIQLEQAAQLILEMGGIITPPILFRTGIESYRVIDGYFEYYAALRAMEIDSRKGKKIDAYIIESEEEKAVYEKQIKMFRHRSTTPEQIRPLPPEPEPEIMPSETVQDEHPIIIEKPVIKQIDRLSTLESEPEPEPEPAEVIPSEIVQDDRLIAIEKTLNQLLAKNDALEKTVSELKVRDIMLHDAVEMIKHVSEKMDHFGAEIKQALGEQIKALGDQMKGLQVSQETPEIPKPPEVKEVKQVSVEIPEPSEVKPEQVLPQFTIIASTPEEQKFLEDINTLSLFELTSELERIKTVKPVRENIIKERQQPSFQPFQSCSDLIKRIKGLGEPRLEKMLKRC
jgi:hypothetical protein